MEGFKGGQKGKLSKEELIPLCVSCLNREGAGRHSDAYLRRERITVLKLQMGTLTVFIVKSLFFLGCSDIPDGI